MLLVTPIACLLLALANAPATPDAPEALLDVRPASIYEVMVVKSGVEIVIKRDGKPVTVRLLGIGTPRIAPKPEVDRLNQTRFLRSLVKNKDLVSLETATRANPDAQGHLLAHVRRATDKLWLNLDMIEHGFATTSNTDVFAAQAEFAAAEQRARAGQLGMWAPQFLANAAQPSTFVRVHRRRVHPPGFGQVPPAGMVRGNNGMVFVPSAGSSNSKNDNDTDKEARKEQQSLQQANDAANARSGTNANNFGYNPYSAFQQRQNFNNAVPFNPSYIPHNHVGGGGYANPGWNAGMPGAGHYGGYGHQAQSSGSGVGGYSGSGGSSSSGSSGSSGESHSGGSSSGHSGGHGK